MRSPDLPRDRGAPTRGRHSAPSRRRDRTGKGSASVRSGRPRPQPPGELLKDLDGHVGLAPQRLPESGARDPDRDERRLSNDGRGSRSSVEERQLSEEVTRPEPCERARRVAGHHPRCSLHDHVEGVPATAVLDDRSVGSERDLLREVGMPDPILPMRRDGIPRACAPQGCRVLDPLVARVPTGGA
jgi:hypothetical protein